MAGPWRRPLAAVGGLLVACAALVPVAARWLTNPEDQRLVDLDVYRTAGQAVLDGTPVYDFVTQAPQLLPFTYPPFSAILAVPMAWLPWPAAQGVMVGLILAALALSAYWAFRPLLARVGDFGPLLFGVLVAALVQPLPVYDQVRFGQVGLFILALCLIDCLAPRTYWPRGMLVGLATAVKLVPGVFLIYFLVTRRREAAGNAVLTAGAATVATFAVLPRDSVDFWFGALLASDRVGSNLGTSNQSLRGFLLRMYWPDMVTSLVWAAAVALVAFVGFHYARRLSLLGASGALSPANAWSAETAGVAVAGLLAVLLSPVAWIHHLVWIIPVVGALAGDGRNLRRCLAAAGVWLFYVLQTPWWGTSHIQGRLPVWEQALGRLMQSSYGLGAIALLFVLGVWLVHEMWRETPKPTGEEGPDRAVMGTLTP
ncbi:glycosyltransferase 87 family protein [Actinocorallia sp. A-T 12471]|uniref:glycosyltransferase 87 family protein n=1 Tax=Actinocorallia sp. A-T 12471 TaxID=3089813 RepID=UPI0029CC4B33|nr:glycosyltransferase 87 family protein [Actinocorallia sp. A-T 12471]MDX6742075.1 glycosyltransferase 87 family protein [Actinocorallia sp. A-T 12471]